MSSSVEDEIVAMKFDNRQFQQGVDQTLSSLGKLKSSLKFDGAAKGIDSVQQSANRFNMNGMKTAAAGVGHSFHAMQIVVGTVIATLTHQALLAGERLIGGFLSPIKAGFENYQEQINAVQTILANTQAAGTNLKDVTGALNELNKYANLTIYNFSEMAKNIGTFTAAGVGLQDSVNAIKGIANLAALSGSNSQQASTAMYQLSQAIAAGQVHLQDWNSVVNAGMGGTVFQRALAQTAQVMGTLKDGSLKLVGPMKNVSIAGQSFRQSLQTKPGQTSWLTSKVLTNTLAQFTGDLSNAQLKAEGFNNAQIKAIQAQAKTALNAATQIKTVSQLTQALKEEVASSWAQVFKTLLGNINQAKKLLSPLHTTLENLFRAPVNSLNQLLKGWSKLGGRNLAIDGIKQAFHDVISVLSTVHKAFRDIFPAQTPKGLLALTKSFDNLMKRLKPGKQTLEDIRKTFRGIFAVVDIVILVIKGVVRGFESLFHSVGSGHGNFLKFTGSLGDILVAFDHFLKKGDYIGRFFENLGSILAIPIRILGDLAGLIGGLFHGFDKSGVKQVTDSFGQIDSRLTPLEKLFVGLIDIFHAVGKAIAPLGNDIGKALTGIGNAIAGAFSSGDYSKVFDVINAVLLGGVFVLIRKAIKKFFDDGLKINFGGGIIGTIKDTFGELTGTLKAMQTQLKAKTLEDIAIAIGILTASMVVLSLINSKDLTKALTAMAAGFGELLAAMAILNKTGGVVKIPALAAALVLLSSAILILTTAIAIMGNLKWETIGRGLAGIAGALIVIAGAMKLMPKGMVLQAVALNVLASALVVMAGAIELIGHMRIETIAKGLLGIAGALVIIAGAMHLMPTGMVLQAAALVLVAGALNEIGVAIAIMGHMSVNTIVKGLVTIAAALVILAGGLYLMNGTLAGSAALVIAAGALAILTPVLVTLGHLSWASIVKGFVALAGAFTIVGLAGLALTELIPSLLGLGAAMLLIGGGMALAGAGALAFATAFSIFVAAASVGTAAIGGLISLIPAFMTAFAVGIIDFVKQIGKSVKDLVDVGVSLIVAILDGINKVIPRIGKTISIGLDTALKVLRKRGPEMFNTGLYLLLQFLRALNKNMPKIIAVGTAVIVSFLDGLGKSLPKIVDAGAKTVIKFINGVAKAIENNKKQLDQAGLHLAYALVDGMTGGLLTYGVQQVKAAAESIAGHLPGWMKKVLHINSPSKATHEIGRSVAEGLANGISDHARLVQKSSESVARGALDTIKMTLANARHATADGIDLSPRITPILDLTELQRGASKIGTTLGKHKFHANLSATQADTISSQHKAAHETKPSESGVTKVLEFTQHNTSPKALSPSEIYRRTRNQLSLAKEAMN